MAGGILTSLLIAIDQFTKYLAETYLAGTSGISIIPGVFELYYLENTGAAFGMLNNQHFFYVAVEFVISAFSIYLYLPTPLESSDSLNLNVSENKCIISSAPPVRVSQSFGRFYHPLRFVCVILTAGALGNMADRLLRGYVVDFLYFSLIDFPVFNLADCYVCIGAGLALIFLFTIYRSEEFTFLKLR